MKRVSIVILNWNGKVFLEQFVPSLIALSGKAQIIIADNNSSDNSIDFVKNNFPNIKIIKNKENYGFAKGYNESLKLIDTEYYILLNSDIQVTANWIEPLLALLDNNKEIAAVQPKIVSYYEPEKFEYAGAAGGFIDKYGYPFCRGRIFQTIETDTGQYDDNIEVFWASGACMMIRSDIFHKVGGFDDDFFAHMEEIDLCWRIKNLGFKIFICPSSKVLHIGGGTLPKSSSRKTFLNMRNNIVMLYKNLPKNKLFKVFLARWVLDAIAALKFLIDGGFSDFFAVTRAHLSFYKHFRQINNKRKKTLKKQVTMIYNGNIVFDYFIKKISRFSELNKSDFT